MFNNPLSPPQTIKIIEDETKEYLEVFRGNIVAILDKIPLQNFKELSVQILQLKIDNEDKLEIAVEIIFDKALLQPSSSQTYAKLCKVKTIPKISIRIFARYNNDLSN